MIKSVSLSDFNHKQYSQYYAKNQNALTYKANNKGSSFLDEDVVGTNDIQKLRRRYNSLLILLSSLCLGLSYIAYKGGFK